MADRLSPAGPAENIISHCNMKCTSFPLRSAGAARDSMLYQAYQAHSDIMVPVRALAGMAAKTVGEKLNGSARPSPLSNLTAAYELIARARAHPRPPALRHRQRHGRQPRGGGDRGSRRCDAVRHAAAFQEGHRAGAAARAADRAAVRPFRHAVARHRAHHAGRARRLHHRLAQCARRGDRRRPLRLRRIYRPHRSASWKRWDRARIWWRCASPV